MRIWYVVGTVEYWLEPEFSRGRTGRVAILGAKLYDPKGRYKGYWRFADWPTAVRKQVRSEVGAWLKRNDQVEKYQAQAAHAIRRKPQDKD